jgi:hypothetical protein
MSLEDMIMAYFNILSRHSAGRTDKNYKKKISVKDSNREAPKYKSDTQLLGVWIFPIVWYSREHDV